MACHSEQDLAEIEARLEAVGVGHARRDGRLEVVDPVNKWRVVVEPRSVEPAPSSRASSSRASLRRASPELLVLVHFEAELNAFKAQRGIGAVRRRPVRGLEAHHIAEHLEAHHITPNIP